jgi:hypothetical protein
LFLLILLSLSPKQAALYNSNANKPGELWKALNAIKKRDNKDPSSNIIPYSKVHKTAILLEYH